MKSAKTIPTPSPERAKVAKDYVDGLLGPPPLSCPLAVSPPSAVPPPQVLAANHQASAPPVQGPTAECTASAPAPPMKEAPATDAASGPVAADMAARIASTEAMIEGVLAVDRPANAALNEGKRALRRALRRFFSTDEYLSSVMRRVLSGESEKLELGLFYWANGKPPEKLDVDVTERKAYTIWHRILREGEDPLDPEVYERLTKKLTALPAAPLDRYGT